MNKIILLVVEDETAIRDMIRFALPKDEFIMLDAENTSQAQTILATQIPHLILLDWMLPGQSGIEFIKKLKQHELTNNIPVIMLTAKAEEENKIKGLETGADDYITKPFSPNELIARIKTVLRRGTLVMPDGIIKVKNIILNTYNHQVSINDDILKLTVNEYKLLQFFMSHQQKTYTRDQLITHVWGGDSYIDERSVDVQIRRLRDRLKPYGYQQLIKTIRGIGYQMNSTYD